MIAHAFEQGIAFDICVRRGCGQTRASHLGVVVSPKREPEAVARRSDPETSWEAARSVTHIRESQQEILDLFRFRGTGMTDEEVALLYHDVVCKSGPRCQSPSGLRTRRAELVAQGLLRDTGDRRRGSTGRRMIVWAAK